MKKKLLLILTIGVVLIACDQRPKWFQNHEKNKDVYQLKWTISELGQLADSTFTDSTDLKTILDFKTIDLNGIVKSVDMQTAIKLYNSNIENEEENLYPFFEIRNTSKVILPVFGQGLWDKIWGKVILDKKTMKVLNMEFEHKGETPGRGGNIDDPAFKAQFIGSKIDLLSNTYSLYQEANLVIEGKQKIEGMSGATITSKGAIEMLNDDLLKYKKYLH